MTKPVEKKPKVNELDTLEKINNEFPHLNDIDNIEKPKWSKFGRKGEIIAFDLKSPITNFYKTCSISRTSETMALCDGKFNNKIAAE